MMSKGVNKILMDKIKEYQCSVRVVITKQMKKNDIILYPKKKIIHFNYRVLRTIPKEYICKYVELAMNYINNDEKVVKIDKFIY
jgi:hypothetical protein